MNRTTRAWKDPVFRVTLDDSELATLANHPVGPVELDTVVLTGAHGAAPRTQANMTTGCCGGTPITGLTCFTCYHWTCWTCWTCEC